MTLTKTHYISYAIAAYLVALLITVPAHLAYRWLKPVLPANIPVQLNGITGTLWSGGTTQARIYGRVLTNMQWQLQPWALIMGRAQARISSQSQQGDLRTTLSLPLTGDSGLVLKKVRFNMPIPNIPGADKLPIPILGQITGKLSYIDIGKPGPFPTGEGTIAIKDLSIEIPGPILLGSFLIALNTDDKGIIQITAKDSGGPLQLSANIQISENDHYTLQAKLESREPGNTQLVQILRLIGVPDTTGKVTIQRNGSIKQDLGLFGLY